MALLEEGASYEPRGVVESRRNPNGVEQLAVRYAFLSAEGQPQREFDVIMRRTWYDSIQEAHWSTDGMREPGRPLPPAY